MAANKYQSSVDLSSAFMVKLEELVRELISQNNIAYYRIESGMEPGEGFGNYLPVVRIVTYFENSIAPVVAVLNDEFDVEMAQPDHKEKLAIDSFASKRLAYNVALKANRQQLTEYKKYGTKHFKIHVCSMLQDAWAGIEKELGYGSEAVPEEARRDFYRVGALLEMADLEFLKIRSKLGKENIEAAPAYESPAPAPIKPVTVTEHIPQPVAAPQPEPVYVAPQPEPVYAAPQPEPVYVAPQPEPVYAAPQPEPVYVAPQPEPTPMPVYEQPGVVFASKPIVAEPETYVAPEAYAPPPPVQEAYTAPPVVEERPEPVRYNDTNSRLNVTPNGIVEKNAYSFRGQQPAKGTFDDKQKGNGQILVDEHAPMTESTLKEYVLNSKLLAETDAQIAMNASARLNSDIDIEGDIERLRFLKVISLKQLHEKIAENKKEIIAFAEKWIGKDNGGTFDKGISLFYLEYLLVGKKNDPGFAVEYVLKFISDNEYSARYIIPTYDSILEAGGGATSKFSHLTLKQ